VERETESTVIKSINIYSLFNLILIVSLIFCFNTAVSAQEYKLWFLEQGSLNCTGTAVGYAKRSYYNDSTAFGIATENAYKNFAIQNQVTISGEQAFWTTETGNAWMGSDIKEVYDTNETKIITRNVSLVDTMISEDFVAILIGDRECELSSLDKFVAFNNSSMPPAWIDTKPQERDYYYAVGIAPEYYYESNSWMEAEKRARLNLARILFTKIESLQKKDIGGQDIKKEKLSVELKEISFVARWKDEKNKICYVLAKVPKQ